MRLKNSLDPDLRNDLASICRETAKSLDMSRNGSRWRAEVTAVEVMDQGGKKYRFYVHDKKSGREFQAHAIIENSGTAEWQIEEVVLEG